MLSDRDGAYTRAMGFRIENDGRTEHRPGLSTFRKDEDGTVRRIAHAPFGPGSPYAGIWHLFALLEGEEGEWEPRFSY